MINNPGFKANPDFFYDPTPTQGILAAYHHKKILYLPTFTFS
jgi:hypothetical protein